jgi:hypothetical protein
MPKYQQYEPYVEDRLLGMDHPHLFLGIAGEFFGTHQNSGKRQPDGHQQTRIQEDIAIIGKVCVNGHQQEGDDVQPHMDIKIFFEKYDDIFRPGAILIGNQTRRIIDIGYHKQQQRQYSGNFTKPPAISHY